MLAKIPPRPDYDTWLRIASAVWSVLPMAEGVQVLNAWSPGYRRGEYESKYKARLQKIGIGTLVHLAKENGWRASGASKRPGKATLRSAPARTSRNSMPSWLGRSATRMIGATSAPPSPVPRPRYHGMMAEESPQAAKGAPAPTSAASVACNVGPQVAPGYCPVCWRHWARALRPGACICTGHVRHGTVQPTALRLGRDDLATTHAPITSEPAREELVGSQRCRQLEKKYHTGFPDTGIPTLGDTSSALPAHP